MTILCACAKELSAQQQLQQQQQQHYFHLFVCVCCCEFDSNFMYIWFCECDSHFLFLLRTAKTHSVFAYDSWCSVLIDSSLREQLFCTRHAVWLMKKKNTIRVLKVFLKSCVGARTFNCKYWIFSCRNFMLQVHLCLIENMHKFVVFVVVEN